MLDEVLAIMPHQLHVHADPGLQVLCAGIDLFVHLRRFPVLLRHHGRDHSANKEIRRHGQVLVELDRVGGLN